MRNLRFAFFMYVLGAGCILLENDCLYLPYYIKQFFELFFDIFLLCAVLTLLPARLATVLKWVLGVVFYACAIADVFCFTQLGTTISPSIIMLVFDTNANEAGDFFTTYINLDALKAVWWILVLAVLHIAACCAPIKVPRLTGRSKLLLQAVALLLVLAGIYSSIQNKKYLFRIAGMDNTDTIEQYMIDNNWASRSLYLPIHRLLYALKFNGIQSHQSEKQGEIFDRITIDQCRFTSPNIILIIGESYNKHHSQLYGYDKETTPRQKARAENGELVVFKDAVTPYNITLDAFKNMFSTNDLAHHESWANFPLFTQVFRKAGYCSTFISNQFARKTLSKTQFDNRNTKMYDDDIRMLDEYEAIRKKMPSTHNLLIFHLYGQHFDYKNRYPEDSVVFKPADYDRPELEEAERQVIAHYDNATRHNDYVVDKIIRKFEQTDAVVLYLSDHGDECYDELRQAGRTHGTITPAIAKNEFQVPFWIWCSQQFRQQHAELVERMVQSADKPLFTDDLPHVLFYLAGIETACYRPELNILHPDYDVHRKRMLRGTTDYASLGIGQ